ncbi:MAG: DUF4350 domain-containing protein [Blastocatellia bacterium]|nr:DUF4350 domain-containing protein [Blastocatellia bacterium]
MDRKALGNILIVIAVIAVMVGLNLVFYVDKREDTETEDRAERSTYSGRTFGWLGYYTLLEESNYPVSRWRQPYTELEKHSNIKALFIVAPPPHLNPSKEETKALLSWVEKGGTAIIVDRSIGMTWGKTWVATAALPPPKTFQDNSLLLSKTKPEEITPWQPAGYFQKVDKVAISDRAAGLVWYPARDEKTGVSAKTGQKNKPTHKPDDFEDEERPEPDANLEEDEDSFFDPQSTADTPLPVNPESANSAVNWHPTMLPLAGRDEAPVFASLVHGKGTVLFLADEYILANNGIRQADNVVFGLNLADVVIAGKDAPASDGPRLLFDEYHHGYRDGQGATYVGLSNYFQGTLVPLAFWQLAAIGLVVVYTFGRRFARPIPVKRKGRASTLEYVSAMAQIQQVAESYDLAIENVYTRFRRALCRYGGVPTNTNAEKLAVAVARRARLNPDEIRLVVRRSEEILNGKSTSEAEMVQLARKMRDLEHKLGIAKVIR